MNAVYLDHAATTPTRPEVVEAMLPFLYEHFGNPSSIHSFGRQNRRSLDDAREIIAASIGAKPGEIVFTSGGTESDNTAIIGSAYANQNKGRHIITTSIEHHAVLHTCQYLEKKGFEVTYLPVDHTGRIDLDTFKKALREDTIVVTIMYGNNEVGTIEPIKEIAELLRGRDIVFHTDAVQAYGLVHLDVKELGVDLLSGSGHKINGPKGIGFLYVRDGVKIESHQHGGEQERKRRAGTENVAAIAGFAEAVKLSQETMDSCRLQYESFRSKMLEVFDAEEVEYEVNGSKDFHLPHVLNVYFPQVSAESLLVNLDLAGIAASSGSACTAGSLEPSHVVSAMFAGEERARSSVRFSFGYGNTMAEIYHAARQTAEIVKRLAG